MSSSVLVAGARTPIGKLGGALSSFSGTQLGSIAIRAALARAGVAPEQVDYVFMGQVLLAGEGQATARQAAARAGIPMTVPATTINKVCLSGINGLYLADQMIRAGDAEIVVAGGMESMSSAPYLLPQARSGYRLGHGELIDSMMYDGLWDTFDEVAMGEGTERYSGRVGISREDMDAFAAASHERAAAAQKDGLFEAEIVPVEVPQRKGDPVLVETDEGVRPGTTAETLGALRPAFAKDGNITAGNASQISDGASAIVVMSRAKADELGVEPLGELVAYGQVAGPDPSLLSQPSAAITRALAKIDGSIGDIDLFELNEAFAAVVLQSMSDLGLPHDVVNPNGGAIALGHPIGASGNRIVLTLLHELGRRGERVGAAALCGGGGQGDAIIVRRGA